jgi:hypothetical protein
MHATEMHHLLSITILICKDAERSGVGLSKTSLAANEPRLLRQNTAIASSKLPPAWPEGQLIDRSLFMSSIPPYPCRFHWGVLCAKMGLCSEGRQSKESSCIAKVVLPLREWFAQAWTGLSLPLTGFWMRHRLGKCQTLRAFNATIFVECVGTYVRDSAALERPSTGHQFLCSTWTKWGICPSRFFAVLLETPPGASKPHCA